jgi:predicted TIM-barrel enzyme
MNFEEIRRFVLADSTALAEGGVDGLMIENFGDVPFYPAHVPAHTVAFLSTLALEVKRLVPLPLGSTSSETTEWRRWRSRSFAVWWEVTAA